MGYSNWKQLNNLPERTLYLEFPLAFTGKASLFKGLTLSCQFILAAIHTLNKAFKEPAKLTYEYFVDTFGMSKETISAALKTLIDERGLVMCVKQSNYEIVPKYRKNDYVEIDTYWLKHEWEVNGESKRFARSRYLVLALLKRANENEKTGGEFISSQARIGKAVRMPKSTAGDSVRELMAADLIRTEKTDGNEKRKRGCRLFTVNPDIMKVKHPERLNKESVREFEEHRADELHKRFMLDTKYRELNERIILNSSEKIKEIIRHGGERTPVLSALEAETVRLRAALDRYLKAHRVKREVFPPGFFKCDITENGNN